MNSIPHVPLFRPKSAIALKQIAMREQFWPGSEKSLWHRKASKGYTTIPKTLPLVLKIMDEMSKDTPVSRTYMALWCSTWDNSFVNLSKQKELAFASGFSGQRMVYTWSARMRLLEDLGFVSIKAGVAGSLSHALVWNPHYVIRRHYEKKTPGLIEASYTALVEWSLEIGASDMTDPLPEASILNATTSDVLITPSEITSETTAN